MAVPRPRSKIVVPACRNVVAAMPALDATPEFTVSVQVFDPDQPVAVNDPLDPSSPHVTASDRVDRTMVGIPTCTALANG